MEAAIHVKDLAGCVIEQAVGDGAHGFGDVGNFAHAAWGNEAPAMRSSYDFSAVAIMPVRMMPGRIFEHRMTWKS